MKKTTKQGVLCSLFIILLLIIDQCIKIWVKTNMCLHESIHITDWFYLSFIENSGMAFGMTFIPKYVLTLFRFIACCWLIWYIRKQILTGARIIWIILISMLLAGATGNLIDCLFYGQIFSGASPYFTSYFVDFGTGYAPLFLGKVVDMFYFPLIVTTYPDWFPVWGGEPFIFFSPVFNFADACVSVSVFMLIIFCRKEVSQLLNTENQTSNSESE